MGPRSDSEFSFRTLSLLCAGPGTGPRYLTPPPFVDVRYNEAFGLGYDEDGPLGLPRGVGGLPRLSMSTYV